jgi:hypothetical protein
VPNPVIYQYWEDQCRLYMRVADCTKPEIANAINFINGKLTPSHSLNSKQFSLRKLIAEKLDPVFKDWLVELGFRPKSFVLYLENNLPLTTRKMHDDVDAYYSPNYPELGINGDLDLEWINKGWRSKTYQDYPRYNLIDFTLACSKCQDFIDNPSETINLLNKISKSLTDEMEKDVYENARTTDTLRNFLNLCKFLSPAPTLVAPIERSLDEDIYLLQNTTKLKRRQRRTPEKKSLDAKLPWYLTGLVVEKVWMCRACDLPTEEEAALQQARGQKNLSSTEKSVLKIANEITHKKGRSQHYCEHHSDINNRLGNRKALRDRPYFIGLLAAMRKQEMSVVDDTLVRQENFRRFAALALEHRSCKKHIKKICELTPLLYLQASGNSPSDELVAEVFEELKAIYVILKLTPDQAAPFNPTGRDIFAECQIISDKAIANSIDLTAAILAITHPSYENKMPSLTPRKIKIHRKSKTI